MFAAAPEDPFPEKRKKGGPNITRGRIKRMQRMRDPGFKVKVIADTVGVSYATVVRHTSKR